MKRLTTAAAIGALTFGLPFAVSAQMEDDEDRAEETDSGYTQPWRGEQSWGWTEQPWRGDRTSGDEQPWRGDRTPGDIQPWRGDRNWGDDTIWREVETSDPDWRDQTGGGGERYEHWGDDMGRREIREERGEEGELDVEPRENGDIEPDEEGYNDYYDFEMNIDDVDYDAFDDWYDETQFDNYLQ